MANRPLVILHGWSDNSSSFVDLAQQLEAALNRPSTLINLADYVSMDDDITFDDISAALQAAWHQHGLPEKPYSVDAIVHSTGGLVIRHWLAHYYTADSVPIKHLVMLAPANFGSPLAHKGRAYYGRITKGLRGRRLFNTGTNILNGLELASPFSTQLARLDRFSRSSAYGPGKVLCTVLIGNTGFTGIASLANQNGSDGTVRVAAANLNCARLIADFSLDPMQPHFELQNSVGKTAFGILDGENHISIIGKKNEYLNPSTFTTICQALCVTDKQFTKWCETLEANNSELMAQHKNNHYKQGYQNTVVFVRDQFDHHVPDYFIEFYVNQTRRGNFEEVFHRDIITCPHLYQHDHAYRSLLINTQQIDKIISARNHTVNVSLTAKPDIEDKNVLVGYRTSDDDDIGAVSIPVENLSQLFQPNRTLIIDIILKREQREGVFSFRRLSD